MVKFHAMFLVRPEVPGLGPKVLGVAEKVGGEAGGLLVNSLVSAEVPGQGQKFRGSPEVPGVVEFRPGRTLNSRSENRGVKTRFPGAKLR